MDVIFGAGALIVWWVIRNAPSGAFWLQSASTHLLWSAEHRTELHCLPPLFTCPTPHHLSLAICALPGLLASFSCSSCGCPECPQGRRAAPQPDFCAHLTALGVLSTRGLRGPDVYVHPSVSTTDTEMLLLHPISETERQTEGRT